MPELPEIEIVKRSLFKMVNKARITDIKINNKNLRYKLSYSFKENLLNEKITNISRRSKYLIIHLNRKILLIHLGMSGKLLLLRKKDNIIFKTSFYYDYNISKKHNHILFTLNNNFILIYNDVRRFGFLKLYKNSKLNEIKFIKKLGIEPLSKSFNYIYFKNFIENKKKNIKSLLMDQSFVSGLGNIYVNEVLFLSKINPIRACNSLKKKEVLNLILNIKKILKFSISKGGSSIKDFKNAYGQSGKFQEFFNVYGKENKRCSRISCKGKVIKKILSNRSYFFCNLCQK